ncbi:cyclic nucleotide-gated channel beta-3 isoform X2 [Cherax quadricarinatus]|uniref:cyclic nucleotide-gated channel beta-3 isoform X2 n=1 Tax=Cherax quadricarinatus TaxID=27406 RepID=UPI00387E993B
MAFPVQLEVATLVAEPGAQARTTTVLPKARVTVTELTPVADTTNTSTRRPVFVIDDSPKHLKTAGMLGSGQVTSVAPTDTLRPSTTGSARLSPASRLRMSPLIGRRRTRVTPLPPTTQLQAPDTNHQKISLENMSNGSHPLEVSKWNKKQWREDQFITTHDGSEVPWPSSSSDSGLLDYSPSSPISTATPVLTSTQGGHSPWIGRYTVPTINIASEHSFTHPLRSSTSLSSNKSDFTSLEHSRYVTERIRHLVSAFSQRANRVKAQITQPPTPSTELSDGGDDSHKAPDARQRLDSLVPDVSSRSSSLPRLVGVNTRRAQLLRCLYGSRKALSFPHAMEPQSRLYISWLLVVCIVYVYNAWVIPLRSVFSEYQTNNNLVYWLTADYLADFVYILDIVVFKSRVMYLDNGFWVDSPKLMCRYYWKTSKFRYDLASLLPLDLLYLKFGPISVFRLPRLIKIHTFWEFFHRLDSVLSSPHAIRVIRTVLYMLFLIHLNTCFYYGFSKLEGIGSNKWVFQGVGNAYIRCFYFATKTATSIGKNPKPENEAEYLYMTCSWLMGVFVFALLIGQIRDIVATATRNQNEYRKVMDQTHAYLHGLNLPASLQERVRLWFTYTWQNQKTLDEMKCLESLPKKMRTDIAINVHIQILSKVQLFQDCDKALLRDLVLKLQPVLYLPGDYVCKKGEVGKEMYIVQTGQVLVMGGERGDVVLATLGEGSVFGEISLLALAGGNRRTADVRSRGFSSLFVLSKADLQATIKDYPEAQEILKKKAKRLIKQNEAREKMELTADENIIIKSREATPKLLHTVLQVVRPDSYTASIIRRSSRTISRSTMDILSMETLPPGDAWPWTPSSMSLEVPTRNSRRSSLEVPCNSHSWMGSVPKTSVSKSLPEEEEEEFLVVEQTDVEDYGNHKPGSPVSCHSHHSISLKCGSRSATPESVFSDQSLTNSSPSLIQPIASISKLSSSKTDGSLKTLTNNME